MTLSFEVGEPVFLNLHLGNGTTGRFPVAIIKRVDGTLITTQQLDDEGNGSYMSQAFNMPNQPIIHVAYKVYSDVGLTTLSEDDQDGFDVFTRKDVADALVRKDQIIGILDQSAGVITGSVSQNKLFGELKNNGQISGEVASEQIQGYLTNKQTIVAELKRC